jgi:hypothetical protein
MPILHAACQSDVGVAAHFGLPLGPLLQELLPVGCAKRDRSGLNQPERQVPSAGLRR